MDLALNNLKRADMPLNKETETKTYFMCIPKDYQGVNKETFSDPPLTAAKKKQPRGSQLSLQSLCTPLQFLNWGTEEDNDNDD